MLEIVYNEGTETYDIIVDGVKSGYARFAKDTLLWFTPMRAVSFTAEDVRRIAEALTDIQRGEKGGE